MSSTKRPLYSREKSPQYLMNRKFGVNHCLSGRFGEEKNLFPRRELNPDPLVVRPYPSNPQLAVFIHSAVCLTTSPQSLPH